MGRAQDANNALWQIWSQKLAAKGTAVPRALERCRDELEAWKDPQLLAGQTCSLPFVLFLEEAARVFAIPQYSVPGCENASYCSLLTIGRDTSGGDLSEFAGATVAVNGPHSQSGHTSLAMELERRGLPMPFFVRAIVSGSHAGSLQMVAEGTADIAAIDCVSFAHFEANGFSPADQVQVIGRTPPAPAPPFITSGNRAPGVGTILYETLREVTGDPAAKRACDALFLDGVVAPNAAFEEGLRSIRAAWRLASGCGVAREWVSQDEAA